MAETTTITQIQSRTKNINDENDTIDFHSYDIGVEFDKVFYQKDENTVYTLKQLYDYLQDYFSNGTFVSFTSNTSNSPEHSGIKIWLQETD